MDLLYTLARLVRPGAREGAYKSLREHFSERFVDELQQELDKPIYSYRCNGLSAVLAKAELDEYLSSHQFNQINPNRLFELMQIYGSIEPISIRGKSVLDFGSGCYNPLGFSMLLYINGANRCVAYEPGAIHERLASIGKKELLFAVLENPAAFRLTDIEEDEMRYRACHLDIRLARERSEIEGEFDFVLSRSVFEHIVDVQGESQFLSTVCTGKQIHRVDFSDHRFAHPSYEPFLYMKDGILQGINGLLPSEMMAEMKKGGLIVEKFIPVVRVEPVDNPLPRYSNVLPEDLGVVLADFVLTTSSESARKWARTVRKL